MVAVPIPPVPAPKPGQRIDEIHANDYLRSAMAALSEVDPNATNATGKLLYAQAAATIALGIRASQARPDLALDYLQTIARNSR